MAENEIAAFLKRDAEPEAAPVEAPQAKPEPEPKADIAAKPAPEVKAEPEDAEPPEPTEGEAVIPRRVYEAVRHERHDWKAKAVEAQTRLSELQRQLEEAKRTAAAPPAPQQPPQQPAQIPNPAMDPEGYYQWVQSERAEQQSRYISLRLDNSEMLAREKHGDAKIEALIAELGPALRANPNLQQTFYRQPHPYEWALKQLEIMRTQREIGDDPAAFRARLVAEERAKWEAEAAAAQPAPRTSPAAGMQPSLASARSVAGRSAPAFTGPTPLVEILRR